MLGSTSSTSRARRATLHPPGYVGFVPETGRRARPPPSSPPRSLPPSPSPDPSLPPAPAGARSRRSTRWGSSRASRRRTSTSRRTTSIPSTCPATRGIARSRRQYLRPRAQRGGDVARPRQHCGDVRLRAPRPGHLDVDARREGAAAVGYGIEGQIKLDLFSHETRWATAPRTASTRPSATTRHAPLRGPLRRDHQGARHGARACVRVACDSLPPAESSRARRRTRRPEVGTGRAVSLHSLRSCPSTSCSS